MEEKKDVWQRRSAVLVTALAVAFIVYLGFKYALGILLPFALAWAFAQLVKPIAAWLSKKAKIPYKICCVFFMLLLLGALVYALFLIGNRAFSELRNFLESLADENSDVRLFIAEAVDFIKNLSEHLPFASRLEAQFGDGFGDKIDAFVYDTINSYLSSLGSKIPNLIASIALSLPEIIVFLTVMILSSFYFCFDRGELGAFFARAFPSVFGEKFTGFRSKLKTSFGGYLRAYMILFLLTLAEVFVGLSVLRVKYSFLLSLFIALIDILPILGVGSVLIPWAIFEIMMKNMRMGLGLLILYGVVLIIRQIVEPKLISKGIGIHPLAAVVSIYAGLRLFGIVGMILGPFAALLIKNLLQGSADSGQA